MKLKLNLIKIKKMKNLNILIISFILFFCFNCNALPGVKTTLTQSGLNYAAQVGVINFWIKY